MTATLEQIAVLVQGRLIGDPKVEVRSAKPVSEAGPNDITFIEDDKYAKLLKRSPAAAAIVGPHFAFAKEDRALPVIEVANPLAAFTAVLGHLKGQVMRPLSREVHPMAYVAPTAKLGRNVTVFPFAFIGDDAEIGDDCVIHPHAVIRERCRLGAQVELHSHVVLYPDVVIGDRSIVHSGTVLGSDGFGYRMVEGRHIKTPQAGYVEVGSDVEIGANCAIDRATFEATRIGDGTKIDNLVMIGHNNQIGRHNILCGQVGIAGSCETGDYVVMAGQVGIKDHTIIGDKALIGAQAGVHRHVPAGQHLLGSPALPAKEQRQIYAMTTRLPEMSRQIKDLAAKVERRTDDSAPPSSPSPSPLSSIIAPVSDSESSIPDDAQVD